MSEAGGAAFEVREFAVTRAGGFRVAIEDLALSGGAAVALAGPSGCGKSTLLAGMLGLDPHLQRHGALAIGGHPLAAIGSEAWRQTLARDVALIMQDARAALDPLQTLGAQVRAATGASPEECADALRRLGVADARAVLRRTPHRVSGGQAQRATLAIALLRRPRLVVADEPAASLDDANVALLVEHLQILLRGGAALLVATHDRAFARALGARPLTHVDGVFVTSDSADAPWPVPAPLAVRAPVVLAARGLGLRVGRDWLVRDVSFELRRGEVVALTGPSGAGKTTLARLLTGQRRPTTGEVLRPAGGGAVQMLHQDAYGSLTPHRSLRSLLAETAVAGFDPIADAVRLGLSPAHLERRAGQLSGGERRRAALLRALSVRPQTLILDEPTASLDRASAIPVIDTLLAIGRRFELSMLLITHDEELAARVAHRALRLERGQLCS